MTSLFSPRLKTFILDIWHQCWKLVRTIFVSLQSMCSGCWKWLSLFGSRAIAKRCCREFKKNFLCFPGNHPKLVMHVQVILEMTGCCLHPLENSLYAQQATDWFIQEQEKVQDLHYLLSCSPNKDSLESHWKKLLVLQLSSGNWNLTYLFGVLHCSHILRI
jgi:hypothetical protein